MRLLSSPWTAACIGALLLTSCSSVGPVQAARGGPFALPAGGQARYLAFTDSGFGYGGEELLELAPSGAGAVRGASFDARRGYGVVAYESQLAIVDLESGTADWLPLVLAGTGVHVAAYGGFATVTSGTTVEIFDLEAVRSVSRTDAAAWLKSVRLRILQAASPVGEGEICLVASNGGRRGKVTLQKVDYSRGGWQMSTRSEVQALTSISDVTVDGNGLFLTGILERMQMGVGTKAGRLWQSLIIERADLDTLQTWEIVYQERQARETVVRQMAAGKSLVAVLFENGTVVAYRMNAKQSTSAPVYDAVFEGARSIAWIGEDRLVVVTGGGSQVISLMDR